MDGYSVYPGAATSHRWSHHFQYRVSSQYRSYFNAKLPKYNIPMCRDAHMPCHGVAAVTPGCVPVVLERG